MYGLVARSLSDMQKGIQFGHAVVEYELMSRTDSEIRQMYNQFAEFDKTFIILNGGSTNSNSFEGRGTLQMYQQCLIERGVKTATFNEPDLNDAMTAIVFLVDERVWDKETYPDLEMLDIIDLDLRIAKYDKWEQRLGGPTNVFLRDFLTKFKLA
jgi:hypothetical protein